MGTNNTSNYIEQGGARTVIGGSLDVVSGGELDVESGGSLKIAGTAITATAAEINQLDGGWASFSTSATPASGSCAVQFVFKDAAGVAMTEPVAGTFYLSEVATGLTRDPADTSVAVLTNGVVQNIDAAVHNGWHFVTDATGKLGITITAAADDYYVVFLKPNGTLGISTVCTVNA